MTSRIALLPLAALFAACTSETYDTGDGKYSYLRADFVEARTDASCHLVSFTTDDGDQFAVSGTAAPTWMQTPDSTYRALIYYNCSDASASQNAQATIVSTAQVLTLKPFSPRKVDVVKTDPVGFESVWTGTNGKYLNLSFTLKTGQSDGDSKGQTIGAVLDSISICPNGKRMAHIRFYHDQGGVPEYYSSRQYASIPVVAIDADSVALNITSYSGQVTKRLGLKH